METHRGEELRLVPLWVFVSEMGLTGAGREVSPQPIVGVRRCSIR